MCHLERVISEVHFNKRRTVQLNRSVQAMVAKHAVESILIFDVFRTVSLWRWLWLFVQLVLENSTIFLFTHNLNFVARGEKKQCYKLFWACCLYNIFHSTFWRKLFNLRVFQLNIVEYVHVYLTQSVDWVANLCLR